MIGLQLRDYKTTGLSSNVLLRKILLNMANRDGTIMMTTMLRVHRHIVPKPSHQIHRRDFA